jgi:hypothetical protein
VNGAINSNGTNGAGIGSGYNTNGTSLVVNLVIVDGIIKANTSYGAGIESGLASLSGLSSVETLSVFGGYICSDTAEYGSGLGSGCANRTGVSRVVSISIRGGTVIANGSSGAGIGSRVSNLDNCITIVSGLINAQSSFGTGIG